LVDTARPIIRQLARAIADTRYFAILTNHQGVVVDVDGVIDHSDKRVSAIARVGVDLSEQSVGTTAIGAALTELRPVWLHRGEHFFNATTVYSCTGAPLFGPDGQCVGMLDLTGVETAERPELKHLVSQSVRNIENALVIQRPHRLLLRVNWPGTALGLESDGLIGVDEDGTVVGANQAARVLLPELNQMHHDSLHCRDLFATAHEMIVDAARRQHSLETPLWNGLRLQVNAQLHEQRTSAARSPAAPSKFQSGVPLKDFETSLIRQSVDDHKGNVAEAARVLGISRATVYRKLKPKR
jgi:transcriptional regulator of acetoin/glycerol metabolism